MPEKRRTRGKSVLTKKLKRKQHQTTEKAKVRREETQGRCLIERGCVKQRREVSECEDV